ncbi:MAG: intradiol ring-cleavage dioxygenase [Verrucomicrobiales bacterium]
MSFHIPLNRRRLLKSLAMTSSGFALPGCLAEALTLTPQQTQGPLYPRAANIPLDKDNDLVQLTDQLSPANGIVTYVTGRVLDSSGTPIRNALVELWHADSNGNYTYSTNAPRNPAADPNFAGIGQFLTGSEGGYRFRTIKAGVYPGRARHFHWGITIPGQMSRFTTQTYWSGETGNNSDGVLNGVTNAEQKASVILNYRPVAGTTTGEVEVLWDIVMGLTPIDPTYPGGNFVVAALSSLGHSAALVTL